MVKVNNHETTTGCWVDGHWGQYGPDQLFDIARGFGYTIGSVSDDVNRLRELAERHEDFVWWERHQWAAEKAEQWLNDNTEDGYYWEWMDGELFLTPERTAMRTRTSHIGGNFVAECDHCGNVCVLWDDDDLEDGVLYCYHTED